MLGTAEELSELASDVEYRRRIDATLSERLGLEDDRCDRTKRD